MITLLNRRTGEPIGTLSPERFETTLEKNLHSEDSRDADYHIVADDLEPLVDDGLPAEISAKIKAEITQSDGEGADIGWERDVEGPDRRLRGKLSQGGEPAPGLWVQAFDRDVLKADDYLGWAFTRPDGAFEIAFRNEDFKQYLGPKDIEGDPEVYVCVLDVDGELMLKTKPRAMEQAEEDWGEIELP